ncbi:D-amino-acid transaminase chloroplastic isoform X1 [Prunus yedoensis var. nudiflora]|uniref:D-amino-acid transaminase chloroplastic isoform X1 n=1 Tax=Prunus yedoensis var. nudiflora TaxID=2094558 RepID=A0A314UNU4_PRUYE|nr:D-amino-acid transaminase chloroplastic isoform X1 [Prunus yedoensis var. nudiflora]
MASLLSLPKPFSQNPHFPTKPAAHSHSLYVIPRNHSFSGHGLLHFQHGSLRAREMRVIRSSNQTEAVPDYSIQVSDVPLLTCSEAIERLKTYRENQHGKQQFLAMYSSIFGGITTDPAAMVIPIDDHMVHRGHGVFDTAAIKDGTNRILRSASMAKIDIPFDRESIRRILIQTVSASKCKTGSLRYWLSAGPGDFQLSPSGCHQPALYAIVIQDLSPFNSKGVKMEAEEQDAFAAIWLDGDGFIAEGPNMNVAFVTKKKELVMPQFDKILSGCTARRVLVLAEGLVRDGKLRGVRVENVTVEEGKKADEMMLIGSGILVRPVVQWDEQVIGDGKEGSLTQILLNLIIEDMKSGPPDVRAPIPY